MLRTLAEILNPTLAGTISYIFVCCPDPPHIHYAFTANSNRMPDATKVISRLLDFIDRVDDASKTGAPRPAFATPDGQPIFPEGELWWLTALQRKPQEDEDKQEADEDGPPSEAEQQGEVREESDEDPLSDDDRPVGQTYKSSVAWAAH